MAGIQAIIARSFAFIYGRNQANTGLLGICLSDEEFYALAQEGQSISIDLSRRLITCAGKSFQFFLDPIEEQLLAAGGLLSVYEQYGPTLFRQLQAAASLSAPAVSPQELLNSKQSSSIEW